MSDRSQTHAFTVVLFGVDGGLYLADKLAARRGIVGCDNSQLDRTATVPDWVDLDTANACNRVDLFLIICDIAAERLTVNAGVILLAQRVGRVAVLSRDKYSRNRCSIQTVHRLNWQE